MTVASLNRTSWQRAKLWGSQAISSPSVIIANRDLFRSALALDLGALRAPEHTENGRSRRDWAALVYSVRGVSDYSSSLRDLNDLSARVRGVRRGIDHPSEAIIHHATLTPRSTTYNIDRSTEHRAQLIQQGAEAVDDSNMGCSTDY